MIDTSNLPSVRSNALAIGSPYYYTGKPCKHGHISERYTKRGHCLQCHREADRKLYYKDHTKTKVREKARAAVRRKENREHTEIHGIPLHIEDPVVRLLAAARARAKRKKLEYSLDAIDIVIPDFCPVLGIPLRKNFGACGGANSPSLDRLDNDIGYVPGNIRVISWRANRLKSDASLEELKAVVAYMDRELET